MSPAYQSWEPRIAEELSGTYRPAPRAPPSSCYCSPTPTPTPRATCQKSLTMFLSSGSDWRKGGEKEQRIKFISLILSLQGGWVPWLRILWGSPLWVLSPSSVWIPLTPSQVGDHAAGTASSLHSYCYNFMPNPVVKLYSPLEGIIRFMLWP